MYTHLVCMRSHVRDEHDVIIRHETRMNLWLVLKDIEPDAADFARVEGLDERVLVNDGAPGSVDYHDTIFHLCKLGRGDDVVGMFLCASSAMYDLGMFSSYGACMEARSCIEAGKKKERKMRPCSYLIICSLFFFFFLPAAA